METAYASGSNSGHNGKWDDGGLNGIGSEKCRDALDLCTAHTMEKISRPLLGLKPKDLMLMLPARVALALQADGWWLRSEIVWHKPNPMPESVTDRPTSGPREGVPAGEGAPRYFYDAEAVRVENTEGSAARLQHATPGGGRRARVFRKHGRRKK